MHSYKLLVTILFIHANQVTDLQSHQIAPEKSEELLLLQETNKASQPIISINEPWPPCRSGSLTQPIAFPSDAPSPFPLFFFFGRRARGGQTTLPANRRSKTTSLYWPPLLPPSSPRRARILRLIPCVLARPNPSRHQRQRDLMVWESNPALLPHALLNPPRRFLFELAS
jgi:hypothetical protein